MKRTGDHMKAIRKNLVGLTLALAFAISMVPMFKVTSQAAKVDAVTSASVPSASVSMTNNGMKVSYSAQSGRKYKVERQKNGGSWTVIGKTTSLTSYLDKNVSNGNYYKYRLKSTQKGTVGKASRALTYLKGLSTLTLTSSAKKQVKVSWSSVPGATGYYVYRNGSKVRTVTRGTSWTNTGLTSGKTYSYYVVPYQGGLTGLKSATKSIKVK